MSTDLQTTNNLPVIKTQGSEIAKALSSPLVNQVDPREVHAAVNQAVAEAYTVTGYKRVDEKASQEVKQAEAVLYAKMINDLTAYIKQYLSTYRVKEIGIAIYCGALGEYGDFMGLSHKSFVQFLKGYKESEARRNELVKHMENKEEAKAPPTAEDQFNTSKKLVLDAFEVYANKDKFKNADFERAGGLLYDFLNLLGLITYTVEQKKQIFSDATNAVVNEKNNQRLGGDFFERQALAKLIDTFKLGPVEGTKEFNTIVAKAKYITLCKYFDALLLVNADLQEILESKRETFITLKS